ncbi:hypothetical protein ACFR99_19170 [Haloarchaeobius amylolyticus]|uniref:DUF8162 domain-containing protein n=1 Tax=Haloarchaeobius amylolyticus TaxID=1198296 RepID=A0ABD6BKJ5_9EURY
MSLGRRVLGWLIVAVGLLAPGVAATICWAPFLASTRLRALFSRLPPFDSMIRTYVVVGLTASLPYVLSIGVVVMTAGPNTIWGPRILNATLLVTLCYVVGIPLLCVVGLPRAGIDWDPTGYGLSTWALVTAGAIWYATLFVVPLTILGLVLSSPGGW